MDEADRLLDMDFGPLLDKILRILPQKRNTFLFSATLSSKVESLQRASLSNPQKVSVSSKYQTVSTLQSYFLLKPHKWKDLYLVYLLNEMAGKSVILFTRTVHETQRVAFLLRSLGFGAIPLHGQLSQSSRLGALGKFRSKSRDILVCTDVAARGLDIPSVDVVLKYVSYFQFLRITSLTLSLQFRSSHRQQNLHSPCRTYSPCRKGRYCHQHGYTVRCRIILVRFTPLPRFYSITDELYRRIEDALNRKLPEYETEKDEVMTLAERVGEAQRYAIMEMKAIDEKKNTKGNKFGKGKGKRTRDNMDQEEG